MTTTIKLISTADVFQAYSLSLITEREARRLLGLEPKAGDALPDGVSETERADA